MPAGLAYSELAVSITIVNEQVPARNRGFLYSIVQGGWPLGVFLASGVSTWCSAIYGWRFVFLLGVLPVLAVIVGRIFIRESERFEHARGTTADPDHVPVMRNADVARAGAPPAGLAFAIVWVFYGASYVATNFYITYWLTQYKGFSSSQASGLLLACGGIGFFFYIIGGWLGETARPARSDHRDGHPGGPAHRAVPVRAGSCRCRAGVFPALPGHQRHLVGAGYAYQGESFPTRVRGTAVGFLSAMQVAGFVVGSILWTVMSNYGQPTLTWLVVATAASLGMWATLCLRRIPPGQELEATAGA